MADLNLQRLWGSLGDRSDPIPRPVDETTDATDTETTTDTDTNGVTSYGDLRYPTDIDTIDHWMKITFYEYSRENRNTEARPKGIKGHITLPVPARLATGYQSRYTNESLGIGGYIAREAAGNYVAAQKTDPNISMADAFSGDTTKAAAFETLSGLMAGYALDKPNIFGGSDNSVGAGIQLGLGRARNPHLAVIYQGPDFRTHQFVWRFSPRDEGESDTLDRIIRTIKYAMHPDISEQFANHLFKYPDECSIEFHNEDYLFRIGGSVIKDFRVEYHSGGIPSYFRTTKAPTDITLSLTIQEVNILTKREILEQNR